VSIFDLDIDLTATDWSYQLGSRFLTAARECGFVCDRAFVSDRQSPEAPVPTDDCACQLAVSVTPGVARPRDTLVSDPVCLPVITADVTLTVDLCFTIPDGRSSVDPDTADARAREIQMSLWQIMQGLMRARSNGTLGGTATVEFGPWEAMGDLGGSSRWQTRWHYRQ